MTANLWVKVDIDQKDRDKINGAISACREVLGEFQSVGALGTHEREQALINTIETLQMILDGEVF